jgi:hypothetical protein
MNSSSFTNTGIAVFVALTLAITISSTTIGNIQPGYAQPTFDTPSTPGSSSPNTGSSTAEENFQQFMDCLFGGEASEEDISSALEGSSASTPTEQEIRDCFTPLYNTGSVVGSTTATGSGSTDETEDTSGDGGGDEDEDEDEGEGSTNGGTSEDEDESED